MTTSPETTPDTARTLNSDAPLNLDNPGDVLAVVQHVFGRLPDNSLVIIGLRDGSTGGHLRVDLDPAYSQPVEMARKCTEWIAGYQAQPSPEAAIALIFADQNTEEHLPAIGSLVEELAEGINVATDLGLLAMWWVQAGGIRVFGESEAAAQGTEELLEETLRRVPQLRPVRAMSPQELTAAFCAPSPLIDEQLVSQMRNYRPWQAPSPQEAMEYWLNLWMEVIEHCQESASAEFLHQHREATAGLLASLEDLNTLSALLVAAAQDPVTGDLPHWAGIEALDAVIYELYPYTQAVARENLLGLKAWVEWTKGNGSASGAFCEAAAAICTDICTEEEEDEEPQSIAAIVEHLQSALGVCPWAQVKRLSYGWWKSQKIH